MQSTDKTADIGAAEIAALPHSRRNFVKSNKLDDVCYEIRGPVLHEAHRLEEEGHRILKLNLGNTAPFGFETPDEIVRDVIHNLPDSQGYAESKGIFSARKAVMQHCQQLAIPDVDIDDIYIGNGVSELIAMAAQGLLNDGDEVLVPAPDYPLWTAVTRLASGVPVHYRCDEGADWMPDMADVRAKTTRRTKAIVIINPNNPTGAVYERDCLTELVRWAEKRDLVVFADEIYAKVIYDDAQYVPVASIPADVLTITFNGLSKAYRAPGFRTGWMVVSGAKRRATDYMEGLDILASMRLCANVPTQHAIQTALGGIQSIEALIRPGGRLEEQRTHAHALVDAIPGVTCVKPKGALYLFPKIDAKRFNITDDERFVLDLLREEHILVIQGTGFNWPEPDHLRLVFLPRVDELSDAIGRLDRFLQHYRQG